MRTTPSPWYISGLIEGAGSFTYCRTTSQLTLVFALRVPGASRELVEELSRFFDGAGRIYDTGKRRDGSPGKRGCFLRVTRPPELLRIVAHFDRHPLRGVKRRAFDTWREMVLLRAAHVGSQPPRELHELADRLTSERRAAHGRRS